MINLLLLNMNKILIAGILGGLLAQICKLVIISLKHKRISIHDFFVTGGMPSSHSAFMIALTTIIYFEQGLSPLFTISLILSIIILRDAYGVRRAVGNEGKAIEKLFGIHKLKSKFHYVMGHTPFQVFVGALLGFIVALVVYLF